LKISDFEQKYCIGTNDGKLKIFWDVTAIIKNLSYEQFPIKYYTVTKLSETNNFFGDSKYAMQTNIECPCVIVQLTDNFEKLIDGNHRLYKAKQLKLECIPCYVLPLEYHKKFIIDYDVDIYEKVVSDFLKVGEFS
jgi:hypothetical protein